MRAQAEGKESKRGGWRASYEGSGSHLRAARGDLGAGTLVHFGHRLWAREARRGPEGQAVGFGKPSRGRERGIGGRSLRALSAHTEGKGSERGDWRARSGSRGGLEDLV